MESSPVIENPEQNVENVENAENPEQNVDNSVKNVKNENAETHKKKKKRHFFEHHIRKILKNVSSERNITNNARIQLNDLAIITCRIICKKINQIVSVTSKKTISEIDSDSAVKLVFTGQLAQKCSEEGYKCLKIYDNKSELKELKGQCRHTKAEMSIPPSIISSFLRQECPENNLSYGTPVYLAGVIEYFLSQVLQLSNTVSISKKNIRITINDLEMGVRSDKELTHFFTKYNVHFFNAGIVPVVHDARKKNMVIEKRIFAKSIVESKFRSWIMDVLKYSNMITLYTKKTRLNADDIELALTLMNRNVTQFVKIPENIEEESIIFVEQDNDEDEENNKEEDKEDKEDEEDKDNKEDEEDNDDN
jgi:histone H3/H4